jgi:hypothetical protein
MRRHLKSKCKEYDKVSALLGYYAASNVSPLPTFRDSVSVPYSKVKKSKFKFCFLDFLTLEDGTDAVPKRR